VVAASGSDYLGHDEANQPAAAPLARLDDPEPQCVYLGTVEAPDGRAAEAEAAGQFGLNDQQRKRLVLRGVLRGSTALTLRRARGLRAARLWIIQTKSVTTTHPARRFGAATTPAELPPAFA
jgi:hypothetical protein